MNDHTEVNHAAPVEVDESIDDRMRRLENAIAALQDTRMMEERVLERVQQSVQAPVNSEATALMQAGRTLLPGMIRAVGSQFNAATNPLSPDAPTSIFSARTWLLTDMIQEVRTFFVLYFDYRYKPSWSARIIPVGALIVFFVSWLWLRNVMFGAVIGALIDYALNFFLVILVYKTMQREAARYRSHIAYLPPL